MRFAVAVVAVACGGGAVAKPSTRPDVAPATPAVAAPRPPRDLALLRVVLAELRDNYVEPARIVPRAMLIAALDRLQRDVAEVIADVSGAAASVRVHDRSERFSIADVDSFDALYDRLDAIVRFVDPLIDAPTDPKAIEYALIHGIVGTLDPHSTLLEPAEAGDFATAIAGKFGGTGMVIDTLPDARGISTVLVRSLVPGGWPAERAGLLPGDRIRKIDGQSTDSLTVEQAMGRLRGLAGTEVVLVVTRDGTDGERTIRIVREVIDVSAVTSTMIDRKVGYLTIRQFSNNVARHVRDAMTGLRDRGARAWVLDLRGNGGGLLAEAVMTADLFVDRGVLVTTVGKQCVAGKCGDRMRDEKPAKADAGDDKQPLVVLIDEGTASAGEILAGALVHLDRAVAIGSTTFGKGSVQVMYDHDDRSKLKLTIAHYLSARDAPIQVVGVSPDIALEPVRVPAKKSTAPTDALRIGRRSFREIDLDKHFAGGAAGPGRAAAPAIRYLAPSEPASPTAQPDPQADFAVQLARDIVTARGASADRHATLRATRALVAAQGDRQAAVLAKALRVHGIAWTRSPVAAAPPSLAVSFAAIPTPIAAGTTASITATIRNTGKSPAHQVRMYTPTDDDVFDRSELVFGRIAPGATSTATVRVAIPERAASGVRALDWRIATSDGDTAIAVPPLLVTIAGPLPPQFEASYQIVDDSDGDGLAQAGNAMRLRLVVRNAGPGAAPRPAVVLGSTSGPAILVDRGRVALGPLEPGETREIDVAFAVARDLAGADRLGLALAINDEALGGRSDRVIDLPVRPAIAIERHATRIRIGATDADVFAAASSDAAVIATVDAGATLAVTGRAAGWYRVELEPGRPGFVRATAATPTDLPVDAAVFDVTWQVTPPVIELSDVPASTDDGSVQLRVAIADDTRVVDAYVTVTNPAAKIDRKKVFYVSNRGASTPDALDFATRVALEPGASTIAIVARDDAHATTTHVVRVYRRARR
jgi:carboxyl-terminal processing protease